MEETFLKYPKEVEELRVDNANAFSLLDFNFETNFK